MYSDDVGWRHMDVNKEYWTRKDNLQSTDSLANCYLLLTSASVPIAIFSASIFGSKEIR
jgi:hypothetical protein